MILKAVACVLAIVAVAAVAVYVMGQFEATRPLHDQIMGYVSTVKDWATQNWMLLTGTVGTVASVGGVALNSVKKAKNEVSQVKNEASSKISSLKGEQEKTQAELAEVALQNKELLEKNMGLEKVAADAKAEALALEKQNENLRRDLDLLGKIDTNKMASQISTSITESQRVK